MAFYDVDAARDHRAKEIFDLSLLHVTARLADNAYIAVCPSSKATDPFIPGTFYQVTAHISGNSTCTCLDWMTRGGAACKHMRALRLVIEHKKASGDTFATQFRFPLSLLEATAMLNVKHPTAVANVPDLPPHILQRTAAYQLTANDSYNITHDFDGMSKSACDVSQSNLDSSETAALEEAATPVDAMLLTGGIPLLLEGIQIQMQKKIEHSAKQILPTLYGLSQLFSDIDTSIKATSDILELKDIISDLHTKLESNNAL